jgi:hypothetical protein
VILSLSKDNLMLFKKDFEINSAGRIKSRYRPARPAGTVYLVKNKKHYHPEPVEGQSHAF